MTRFADLTKLLQRALEHLPLPKAGALAVFVRPDQIYTLVIPTLAEAPSLLQQTVQRYGAHAGILARRVSGADTHVIIELADDSGVEMKLGRLFQFGTMPPMLVIDEDSAVLPAPPSLLSPQLFRV